MPRSLPLDREPDLPQMLLKLDGGEADAALHDDVLRVDVHEEVGRLARAILLVRNWDEEARRVKHSDGVDLAPGTPVEIGLGYSGAFETVFDGVVTDLSGAFLSSDEPVLRVGCRCRGALLAAGRRSRVFEELAEGDVAASLAGEHGLSADTENGPEHPTLVQWNTTDWDFLVSRARRLGWALYVRGERLAFRPPDLGQAPVATLEWGATLLETTLDQDMRLRRDPTAARAWDPESLEAKEAVTAPDDAGIPAGSRRGVGNALADTGWSGREDRVGWPGPLPTGELDSEAGGRALREALAHHHGSGRSIGLPQLRIDRVLELRGLGERWSGPHYLTAVRHVLDGHGYVTEFQLGEPPRLVPNEVERAFPAARDAGLVPAIVEDLDDPNGWGRVKVRFPWMGSDLNPVWARLSLPAAGAERGFFFIPENGDEVVVGFLGDEARYPVVVGSLWNGNHAPPVSLDPNANDVRSIVSRAGHRLTFDDADDAPAVRVETAAGQSVILDDTEGSEKIEMADAFGNRLTLDGDGITLEAAPGGDITLLASGGTVALEGTKIEGASTGPAKLESSATLDLKASATLGISGALVKLNS